MGTITLNKTMTISYSGEDLRWNLNVTATGAEAPSKIFVFEREYSTTAGFTGADSDYPLNMADSRVSWSLPRYVRVADDGDLLSITATDPEGTTPKLSPTSAPALGYHLYRDSSSHTTHTSWDAAVSFYSQMKALAYSLVQVEEGVTSELNLIVVGNAPRRDSSIEGSLYPGDIVLFSGSGGSGEYVYVKVSDETTTGVLDVSSGKFVCGAGDANLATAEIVIKVTDSEGTTDTYTLRRVWPSGMTEEDTLEDG